MEKKEIGSIKDEERKLNEEMVTDLEKMFMEHNGGITKKEKKMMHMICNMRCINITGITKSMFKSTTIIITDKIDGIKKDIQDLKYIIGVNGNGANAGANKKT